MIEDPGERVVDFLFGLTGPHRVRPGGDLLVGRGRLFPGFVTPGELAIATAGALAFLGLVTLHGVVAAAMVDTVLGNTIRY